MQMEKKTKPFEDKPYVEEASVPGDNELRTAVDPALAKHRHRPAETGTVEKSTADDGMGQGRPEDRTKP